MQTFEVLVSPALSLAGSDIDTDQIIPGRFMHVPRVDYGRYCFHDQRYDAAGAPLPDFPLNRQPPGGAARILLADRNFGCGSSREHAVYTLYDFGIRAILAPSFGEIFYINCCKNGLLPVVTPLAIIAALRGMPDAALRIDLPAQRVTAPGGIDFLFDIDGFSKHCMVHGLDDIDYTLQFADAIRRHESRLSSPPASGAAGSGKTC